MILQKPCPPCCTITKWPTVHVPDGFYQYSRFQKIAALEQAIVDKAKLEKPLRPVIEYLKDGNNIALKLG